MHDSGRSSEDQNANRNEEIKTPLKVQMETRTLLGIGLEAICLTKNLSAFCSFPDPWWDMEFKGDELINLVEKISRCLDVQLWHDFFLCAFS
jgi:hypothetical protein